MMRGRRTREEDHDGEMKIVFEGVNVFFVLIHRRCCRPIFTQSEGVSCRKRKIYYPISRHDGDDLS